MPGSGKTSVEIGPGHIDRLVIVHFEQPSQDIHNLQLSLFLQTLKERLHEAISARLLIRHQRESAHELLVRTLRRGPGPKHRRLVGILITRTLFGPQHAAHHQLHLFLPCSVETHNE